MKLNLQPSGGPVSYENASIGLEAVRALLESEGQLEEARTLRGLEIVDPVGAEVALDALRSIRALTPETGDALRYAIQACYQAKRVSKNAA